MQDNTIPPTFKSTQSIYDWVELLEDIPNHFYPSQSIHEKKLNDFFKKSDSESEIVKIESIPDQVRNTDAVIICFTNRCGSNLLTELLHDAGLGVMKTYEPLNYDVVINFCKNHQIEHFSSYLSKIALAHSINNRFCFKAASNQLFWMSKSGYLHIFKNLKFIHIKRRNLVDQAVSLYKATQNNQWHSNMTRQVPDDKLECQPFEVLKILRGIIQSNAFFEYFFALHSIDCHTVYYEDIISDLENSIKSIFNYLNLCKSDDYIPSLARTEIQKQSSLFNQTCIERFISYYKI